MYLTKILLKDRWHVVEDELTFEEAVLVSRDLATSHKVKIQKMESLVLDKPNTKHWADALIEENMPFLPWPWVQY
jgi:hypothetical protein